MSRYRRSRTRSRFASRAHNARARGASRASGPFVAFLLIACFGILFAGCSRTVVKGPNDENMEDTTFTADDVAKFRELSKQSEVPPDGSIPNDDSDLGEVDFSQGDSSLPAAPPIDPALAKTYAAARVSASAENSTQYRVTNAFVNVRSAPQGNSLGRLERGETVTLMEFTNASWAKVNLPSGGEGFVTTAYIAKPVNEQQLAEQEKLYANTYFVNYQFVNVRKEPSTRSEKIGQIPGQAFVTPVSIEGDWAKVSVDGQEGFVSTQFLKPFRPNVIVRQDLFTLPIFHYQVDQENALQLLVQHATRLQQDGVKLTTLRKFFDLVLLQEERDQRLEPKTVVIAVSGVTPANVANVSATLRGAGIPATLFLTTKDVGVSGISERTMLTLIANGFDIQSSGHTGDDLRGLPNAQMALELSQSRTLLEEMTGKTVFAVLYPDGGVNDRIVQKALDAGYLFGISNVREKTFRRDQFLRLPSVTITPAVTPDDVARIAQ